MLDTLRGNRALREELLAALEAERLPHSVLLVGEAGCGAGYAARCLAADYLFPGGGQPARDVLAGQVSVINEKGGIETGKVREALAVRPAGKQEIIRVDQIRTARSEIFKSSLSTEGRVVLVYGAQAMNQNAANAFLKVLEEPPEGVLFILTAASQAAVLPTIRSRCAIFGVAPVSRAECAEALREREKSLSAAEADTLSALFAGKIGSCLAACAPARRAQLETANRLYAAIGSRDEYAVLALLAGLEKDKPAARRLLADLAALCAATLRDPAFAPAGAQPLAGDACAAAIAAAGEADRKLAGNLSPKLVLTLLGAGLCGA